jgi:hypothetical protein
MSYQPFGARPVFSHLTGLDFGLRVRVRFSPQQRTILSVSDNLTVQSLVSELVEIVSGLTVYSYSVRARLEQLTYALQANAQFGAWSYLRRAALDLAALLANAKKRGWLRGSLALTGAQCALRLADLCGREVR